MLLSILIQGKNDNYGSDSNGNGGVCQRLKLSLNKLFNNINHLNANDIEIVLCDWASEDKIVNKLILEKCTNFKCVYVSPEIGKKYSKEANYSISHAYNVAFKHSCGEYKIFWDSDCYTRYIDIENLYKFTQLLYQEKIYDTFFWGSRYHLPRHVWNTIDSYQTIDKYLESLDFATLKHDKINLDQFSGTAMALMLHKSIGLSSNCWWEELPYWGWQDIELHHRLASRYNVGCDLEDQDIKLFHLDHHDSPEQKRINNYVFPKYFNVNLDKWGLQDEQLEII